MSTHHADILKNNSTIDAHDEQSGGGDKVPGIECKVIEHRGVTCEIELAVPENLDLVGHHTYLIHSQDPFYGNVTTVRVDFVFGKNKVNRENVVNRETSGLLDTHDEQSGGGGKVPRIECKVFDHRGVACEVYSEVPENLEGMGFHRRLIHSQDPRHGNVTIVRADFLFRENVVIVVNRATSGLLNDALQKCLL